MKRKNFFVFPVVVVALAMLLSGCGKKSKSGLNLDYLPVQMSKGDSWSIIDKNGEEVVKEEYPADSKLSTIRDGVYWVYSNEKYQLYSLDNPKKPVTDEEFATATGFHAGVAVVGNPNQQIRIVNAEGKTVATLGKDIKRCYEFTEDGYAIIRNTNDKEGIIDTKGNIVVAPAYADVQRPNEGLFLAKKDDDSKKVLILDMKGQKQGEIDTDKYYLLNEQFNESKIAVRAAGDTDAHTIILDKTGQKLFDIKKSKEEFRAAGYWDGHMVFSSGEEIGVVDDKGEVIIRPKYRTVMNNANGTFTVRKDDKWGVVDTKDETIIDFDYDDTFVMMGDNYLFKDGSSWSLVNKEGKELTSFSNFGIHEDSYAEYVDVSGLTTGVYNFISKGEQAYTPAQLAKEQSLSLDSYHYQRYIENNTDVDGKASVELTTWYENNVAEEQTHQEEVNDGWFTTTRTVSDGWNWSTEIPTRVYAKVTLSDNSIKLDDFYKGLVAKFAEGRTKVSDGVFTKNIKAGGSTVECRTTVEKNYSNIEITLDFIR